jgi:hypothetical protein
VLLFLAAAEFKPPECAHDLLLGNLTLHRTGQGGVHRGAQAAVGPGLSSLGTTGGRAVHVPYSTPGVLALSVTNCIMASCRQEMCADRNRLHSCSLLAGWWLKGWHAALLCGPGTCTSLCRSWQIVMCDGCRCSLLIWYGCLLLSCPAQVHLVDKKFGGELTKADVFGVEVSGPGRSQLLSP